MTAILDSLENCNGSTAPSFFSSTVLATASSLATSLWASEVTFAFCCPWFLATTELFSNSPIANMESSTL